MKLVYVVQECTGDDKTAFESVVKLIKSASGFMNS